MAQFEALVSRAEEHRKDAIFCAGIAASATYNVWRAKGDPPVAPNDFLPEERPDLTDDELADEAAEFFERLVASQPKAKPN
jgi:hypothetical protein